MASLGQITINGQGGRQYTFDVYPWGTSFKSLGAVYYISKRIQRGDGSWGHTKIYIGQTSDLSERFDDHHKKDCFSKHGANAISILLENNEDRRFAIEDDLITAIGPPCND